MLAVASRRGVAFGAPSFYPDGDRGILSRCDVEPPLTMPGHGRGLARQPATPERTGVIPAVREGRVSSAGQRCADRDAVHLDSCAIDIASASR
jgi:hypothetical protein